LKLILIASDFAKFRKGTIHDKIIKIMSQWYESNDEVVLSLESDEVKFLEKISETTINNQVADALPLNDKKNHAQIDIKQ